MSLQEKLSQIQIVLSDVDGVLTDGRVGYSGREPLVFFSIQDGLMTWLGKRAGLKFGWLSGRLSQGVLQRARELKIDYVALGVRSKKETLEKWIREENWKKEWLLYVGDDINDLAIFQEVGVSVAVPNAREVVREKALWNIPVKGGWGAISFVVEEILKAKKMWDWALASLP